MPDTGTSLWLLLNQAESLIQQGDQRGARALFEQAMMLAAAADDPWMTAVTYIRSATTEVRLGEIERALLYYGRGADAFRGKGGGAPPPAEAAPLLQRLQQEPSLPEDAPPVVQGLSRLLSGMAARRAGDLALAEDELRAALPLLTQGGDRDTQAVAMLELAVVLDESQRYAESEPLYRGAADSARAVGDAHLLCDALHDLGLSLREQGRTAEAEQVLAQGAEAAHGAGNKWNEARIRAMLGVTLLDLGQKEAAYAQLSEARPVAEEAGHRRSLAICWRVEGWRWAEQGSYQQARECLEYAANLLMAESNIKLQPELAECLRELGDVTLALGDTSEAKNFYSQSLDLYSRLGQAPGPPEVLLALGNISREEGEHSLAYSYYTKAARHAREQGNAALMGRCHMEMAELRATNGRIPEAQWNLTCARALFAQGDPQMVAEVDATLANIRSFNPEAYDGFAHAFNAQGLGDVWSLNPP